MNNKTLELLQDLAKAGIETAEMVGISAVVSAVVGLPLGVLLYATAKRLFWENRIIHVIGGFLVNVIRSAPFVILLVLLLPLTQWITGTTIGSFAASVPLSVAAIAFFGRLTQAALCEVDPGVVEAATATGAKPLAIIFGVLIPEASPGLVRAFTVTLVSLIGYSAMAGIVGGGGVGDLAIRYGYYRYQTDVMVITIIALVIIVQVVQFVGDRIAGMIDKR